MKKLTIILSVLFLMGCTGQSIEQNIEPYHNICPLRSLLTQATDGVHQIYTTTIIKSEENEEGFTLKSVWGNAFAISKHRLLTAGHLVLRDRYYVPTPFRIVTVYISPEDKIKEETWLLLDDGSQVLIKIIYRDTKLDFAVLEVEEEVAFPVYSIGNSDDFYILDQVFVVSDFGTGKNIKVGHIMQLDFVGFVPFTMESIRNTDMFGFHMSIEHGQSGAPVLLFHNNKLEVVGVISVTSKGSQGSSYAVRINSIMNRFRDWQNEHEL